MWFLKNWKPSWAEACNQSPEQGGPVRRYKLTAILAGVAAVVFVGFLMQVAGHEIYERFWASDGKIIVNSPTVYTRQRLVNDRLMQMAWLKEQLQVADQAEPAFRSIDQARSQSYDRAMQVMLAGSSATGEQKSPNLSREREAKSVPTGSVPSSEDALQPTTSELYKAKSAFRDLIRSEMLAGQLDDRHDLESNTVHRLTFHTTLLRGTRSDSVAVVKVEAREIDENRVREDLEQLYLSWKRQLEKVLDQRIKQMANALINEKGSESDPEFRVVMDKLFGELVCGRGCSAEDLPGKMPFWVSRFIDRYAVNYKAYMERQLASKFESELRGMIGGKIKEEELNVIRRGVINVCRWLPPGEQEPRVNILQVAVPGGEAMKIISKGGEEAKKRSIRCPEQFSVDDLMTGYGVLYDLVKSGANWKKSAKCSDDLQCDDINQIIVDSCERQAVRLGGECELRLSAETARCIASDYVRVRQSKKLAPYFSLAVRRWAGQGCQLVLDTPQENENRKVEEPHLRLLRLFNGNREMYSYGVSPKQVNQQVSHDVEAASLVEGSAVLGGQKAIVSALARNLAQSKHVESHSIVVGFGLPSPKRDADVPLSTSFGWVVAPLLGGSGQLNISDIQIDLSALVSMPSWFRKIDIKIEACWVRRDELRDLELAAGRPFCRAREEPKLIPVRLPSTVADISRKLEIEVIEEPYVDLSATNSQSLAVGIPGAIVLKGSRLWRSTEVTLGAQLADSIMVLPDMNGILVRFDCVERPGSAYDPRITNVPNRPRDWTGRNGVNSVSVFVWTSEGVAPAGTVNIIDQNAPAWGSGYRPACDSNQEIRLRRVETESKISKLLMQRRLLSTKIGSAAAQ